MIFDTTSEFGRVEEVELPEGTDSSLTVKRVYGEDEGDYAVLLHSTKLTLSWPMNSPEMLFMETSCSLALPMAFLRLLRTCG